MAKNYKIVFKSLRAGTVYTLSIGGGDGTAVPLKGGAQPFTTQEDDDEDQFRPVRTQSGYFRIVDDGKDADGNAFDWKDLIPSSDTSRPVTLVDDGGHLKWQGFMQAQNFGGTLYGNPQEREFPVQCPIAVLNSMKVSTNVGELRNFAYIIFDFFVTNMPSAVNFQTFIFQGGYDAQRWLLLRVDWMNFLRETEENDLEPAYTHYEVLEDICRFWGWTIRTKQQVVYFTCMDDPDEQTMLTLTQSQLQTMAGGTTAGSVAGSITTDALSGDIFLSMNNDTFQNRGPKKATVRGVCNEHETVLKMFPTLVENGIDNNWAWHAGGEDKVGYFESATISRFGTGNDIYPTQLLQGYVNGDAARFSMRQVFTSKDAEDANNCDMVCINHIYNGTQFASVQTKKPMCFTGGTLKLSGTVYFDSYVCDWDRGTRLIMRLGIGSDRQNAKWWYMNDISRDVTDLSHISLDYGWSSSVQEFRPPIINGDIKSTGCHLNVHGHSLEMVGFIEYTGIPIRESEAMSGKIFLDFLGLKDQDNGNRQSFQIADFKVDFSRDIIELPSTLDQIRARVKSEKRVTSKDYTSENNNSTQEEWNADCIFASDNHMKYGYGLLITTNNTFMETVSYNNNQSNLQHPEQHLANRVTSYWAASKRRVKAELRTEAITEPQPSRKVTLDGTTFNAIAISHEWRDDVTTLTLLEM